MKKYISSILFICLLVCSSTTLSAQRIAYVYSEKILSAMPETKEVQKKIEAKATELQRTAETMYKDYESKVNDFQQMTKDEQVSPTMAKLKQDEIQSLQKRIQSFEQNAQQEILALEQQLSSPILEKAQKAIEKVAEKQGYAYILDASAGNTIVLPDGDDLTQQVKTTLGL